MMNVSLINVHKIHKELFSSCLLTLLQSEGKSETFHLKMRFHLLLNKTHLLETEAKGNSEMTY